VHILNEFGLNIALTKVHHHSLEYKKASAALDFQKLEILMDGRVSTMSVYVTLQI